MYTLYFGEHRAHFLAMPRTGSKACGNALKAQGAVSYGGHHTIDMLGTLVQDGDLIMSTTRNHFDWFVSFWYLNGCPGKFEHFVPTTCEESEWIKRTRDMSRCELFWNYAPLCNVILRYENLDKDINEAMSKFGFPKLTLKQEGQKKPRPFQTYYRPATIQYVIRHFGDELTKYGYEI